MYTNNFSALSPTVWSKYSHKITKDLGNSRADRTTYFCTSERKLPKGFLLCFTSPEAFPVPSPVSSHIPSRSCHFSSNGTLMGVSIFLLHTCEPCPKFSQAWTSQLHTLAKLSALDDIPKMEKCQVLHLGWSNAGHRYRLVNVSGEQLYRNWPGGGGNSSSARASSVPASQECKLHLGYIKHSKASQSQEAILLAIMWHCLEYCMHF